MKIPNLAAMPVARFPAPGAGPPQAAPLPGAGPSMPVDRLRAHTVHLAHSQAPHLLSPGNLQSSGESSPDTPPQAPPRPQVSQKEARRSPGHRRHTLASRVGGGVPVAARDTPCAFTPRVPRGQSPAVLALLFFVRGRPGHREVLSSTPGLPPPDARSSHLSPVVTSKDASRPCQMGTGGSVTPGRAPRVQTEVCSGHSHVPRSPCRSQMLCGLGLLPSSLLHDFELYQLPPLQGQGAERH